MLKIQSLRVKIIIFTSLFLVLSFPLLFMNCSLDEGGFGDDDLGSLGEEKDYTENVPPDKFPDPDNPNTRGKIVWPENAKEVANWEATSKITSFDINTTNGQVSIAHTKTGQWNPTTSINSDSVEDPVEGNAWIIVPLNGKGYAAPYDWIGKSDPDHMLDVDTLDGLYQQLPIRSNVSELANWEPLPGDKIGFMVSGLVKGDIKNVEERSKMIRVTLPDKNGKVSTETCSLNDDDTDTSTTTTTSGDTEDTDISACPETACEALNRISIIDDIVHENSSAFRNAIELSEETGSVEDDDERWEFMDKVIIHLRATDTGFGYTCINESCVTSDNISTSKVAYTCKENTETSTSPGNDIITIDIFNSNGSTKWDPSDPEEDQPDGWIFPRPGALNTTTTTTGGGPCSSDTNAPISRSNIVQRIADETGTLYKTNPSTFTQRVVECLRDIDNDWGRYIGSDGTTITDTVAYRTNRQDNNPYSIKIINDVDGSKTIGWSIQSQNNQCGRVGGTWHEIDDISNCIIELKGHCTQEQIDSGDYGTINNKCHPKCDSFDETNVEGVDIGTGDECDDDTGNYNILTIKNTYEEEKDGSKCCRRSSKRFCGSGYRLYDGNCYPTCHYGAKLAGYASSSNIHIYENNICVGPFCTDDCGDLSEDGHKDWADFNFYDPYTFRNLDSTADVETCRSGDCPDDTGCCIRGSQNETPIEAYDGKGWNQQDRNRVSAGSSGGGSNTSSTTTTTADTSSGNECTASSADIDCFEQCSMSENSEDAQCENGECVCP